MAASPPFGSEHQRTALVEEQLMTDRLHNESPSQISPRDPPSASFSHPLSTESSSASLDGGGVRDDLWRESAWHLTAPQGAQSVTSAKIPSTGTGASEGASSVIPKRGADEASEEALAKLDRISKAHETRRKWRARTGIAGLARDAQKRAQRRTDRADEADSSSDESSDLSRAFEGVKVMITSLPDHPVLGRVRDAASKYRGRFADGRTSSPTKDDPRSDGPQSRLRNRLSLRKSSLNAADNRQSIESVADLPSASSESLKLEPVDPLQGLRSRTPAHTSDLMAVNEDATEADVSAPQNEMRSASPEQFPDLVRPIAEYASPRSPTLVLSPAEVDDADESCSPRAPPVDPFYCPEAGRGSSVNHSETSFGGNEDRRNVVCEKDRLSPSQPGGQGLPSPSSSEASLATDVSDECESEGQRDDTIASLNLNHGSDPLTKKQRKRRSRAFTADADEITNEPSIESRHKRTASLTNHVSRGLQFASTQSRNRRAIERYSPNPAKHSFSGRISGPTSPTPEGDQARTAAGLNTTSRRSSLSEAEANSINEKDDALGAFLQRWNTSGSLASTVGGAASGMRSRLLQGPRNLWGSRRRKWTGATLAEEEGAHTPKPEDLEKELDQVLDRLTAQEAPEEAGERFVYDVLYENQRGLLVFGIPKFSPRTLMEWDPAAWTDPYGKDVAYNIVSAQLPDPSWHWVHPEWLIDMSGDVDEAGWEYALHFGKRVFPGFGISKKTAITEEEKEDNGLEALKRSAKARQPKWRGVPDPWTFVRRRRWIRLRRREALVTQSSLTKSAPAAERASLTKPQSQQLSKGPALTGESKLDHCCDDTEDLSDDDEEDEDGSDEYDQRELASSDDQRDTFLPRRLPGHQSNGVDPLALRPGSQRDRQLRHAREFTGTVRELKSALPAILERRQRHAGAETPAEQQANASRWWRQEIDARNPFISWKLVQRRLADPDLVSTSASLRARQRRYAGRSKRSKHLALPSSFSPQDVSTTDKDTVSSTERFSDSSVCSLTREALIDINFRRVVRIMRACKVDRQKLELFRLWLGAESVQSVTRAAEMVNLRAMGLIGPAANPAALPLVRQKWKNTFVPADTGDVWDVLERKLDRILLLFEYQGSRATLLRLLLTMHASSHPQHVYRPQEGVEGPPELSAAHQHGTEAELGPDVSRALSTERWRKSGTPRLEFWSDLQACARVFTSPNLTPPSANESGRPKSSPSVSPAKGDTDLPPSPPPVVTNLPDQWPNDVGHQQTQQSIHRSSPRPQGEADLSFLRDVLALPDHERMRDLLVATSSTAREQ